MANKEFEEWFRVRLLALIDKSEKSGMLEDEFAIRAFMDAKISLEYAYLASTQASIEKLEKLSNSYIDAINISTDIETANILRGYASVINGVISTLKEE